MQQRCRRSSRRQRDESMRIPLRLKVSTTESHLYAIKDGSDCTPDSENSKKSETTRRTIPATAVPTERVLWCHGRVSPKLLRLFKRSRCLIRTVPQFLKTHLALRSCSARGCQNEGVVPELVVVANVDKYDSFLSTLHGTSSSSWTEAQESDKLAVINRVVGLLRNGSLLIDDIEDDSQLRRRIPVAAAAHKIYGVPQTINTANYVYFSAYQELAALRLTVWRCVPISSSSSDSGLGDDSPAAEKADFPDPIIPDYDLDIVVTGTTWAGLERGTNADDVTRLLDPAGELPVWLGPETVLQF
ncbi:hypothetical protein F4604DRAFT_1678356 [Suillus subluteus]|nr:hypothetical protein F4604DRAFT_1678356 [Suillus subluteus]